MNKGIVYFKLFLPITLIVIVAYILLAKYISPDFGLKPAILVGMINLILYGVGSILIFPAFSKPPDQFVSRFMILTTIQLLLTLFMMAFLVYKKVYILKTTLLHFLCVFVILLIVQSALLIRFSNRKEK